MPSSKTPNSARIEVFRSGKFTSMEGAPLSYSSADLQAIAQAYDFDTAPAPVVIGHPSSDAPAFAWVGSFEYDAKADRLNAVLKDIEPSFAAAVQAGQYRKVSLQFFPPHHPANPNPGAWYPKHVGFLGAAAPAVTGLRNVSFSIPAGEAITFEGEFASFGDAGNEQAASLFRRIRDFFISEHGLEKADKVLPAYDIEWLAEIEAPKAKGAAPFAGFSTPPQPAPAKEIKVSNPTPASFADREAELAAREQRIADRERESVHAENVSFAARLVGEGRLLPVSEGKVVAILDGLTSNQTVSFSEGEAQIPTAEALRQVLQEQPVTVSFGRVDLPTAPGEDTASFAADGKPVNPEKLALHTKAEAYMRQNPTVGYSDALKAVS